MPGNEESIVSSSIFLPAHHVKNRSVFPEGTTIFPKRGGAIATNRKRLTAIPICADLNIMGVIPSAVILPKFLYYFFVNIDMRELGGGSSIPQINNYDISPLAISFPESIKEQRTVLANIDELAGETVRLEFIYQQKLTALTELKQSLLQKAFSGELTADKVATDSVLKEENIA